MPENATGGAGTAGGGGNHARHHPFGRYGASHPGRQAAQERGPLHLRHALPIRALPREGMLPGGVVRLLVPR